MTTEMQQFWETRDRLMRTGSVERMETFLTQWQQKMETKGNFLDWASVTNEKGLFYRKIGLFEESISVMESLRKALLKERGRHSPEYASLLNNLGGTYRKMGDKDTAIALFEESLAIYKAQARLNVSVCASLYLNLSQVYQEKGELEKRRNGWKKACVIFSFRADKKMLAGSITSLPFSITVWMKGIRQTSTSKRLYQSFDFMEIGKIPIMRQH